MKIPLKLVHSLRGLSHGSTWTITMVEDYFGHALRLEKLGLVKFTPRLNRRRDQNGSDVEITPAGLALLASVDRRAGLA